MNHNLYALFESRFPLDKSRIFLETNGSLAASVNGHENNSINQPRKISFSELESTVAHYATLIESLGVIPGERVAVQVEKSPEALMLYLACLKAGVVYLPLNSAYRESEVAYFLSDATPKIFIHASSDESWAAPLCAALNIAHRFTMNEEASEQGRGSWSINASNTAPSIGFEKNICHREPDDLAAILYTSGTTGRSKGAMITHQNLSSNALTLHQYWGFKAGDVLLHALPLFHVHGLFVAAHTALLNAHHGGPMIFQNKFDAAAAIIALKGATVFMGVPTMYTRLLADPTFDAARCANMRLFVSGSAPLLAETFAAFKARTGHTILERYGMTETGMITSNPYFGGGDGGDGGDGGHKRKGGTVGLPLPGVHVRVMNDDGSVAKPNEIGGLQVRGPNVLSGYWQMPEKNKEEFTSDHFFKTGDLGFVDDDGYISIVGRSKDLVISGGYNIYPKELELLIDEIDGVVESAVIGLPHPDFGEAVAVVVVCRDSASAANIEKTIINELKMKLANFKVPKRVFVADDLPRNAMGKVQKNELRKRFAGTFSA